MLQRLGDGIVAFFGYPLAHEGEAERAIHAGLEHEGFDTKNLKEAKALLDELGPRWMIRRGGS